MNGSQKIAIVGAGNLGIAIAKGIVEKGLRAPAEIILTRRHVYELAIYEKEGFLI